MLHPMNDDTSPRRNFSCAEGEREREREMGVCGGVIEGWVGDRLREREREREREMGVCVG